MATTTILEPSALFSMTKTITPFKVCFSFAAYAKSIINYLKSLNIPIDSGLTSKEFSSIESTFNFRFPPDLRAILQEGVPIEPGFPNWRSASYQQLDILINLPILGLLKDVKRFNFWVDSWGDRPVDLDQAVDVATGFLKKAPVLVPIYRNFYIPAVPILAGNPVFYVNGSDIKVWSFDLCSFFQRVEFRRKGEANMRRPSLSTLLNLPAWAATEPRRIEFWSVAVERREKAEQGRWNEELGEYLEDVFRRLRNGGWKEEDVKEMNGGDMHVHGKNDDSNTGDYLKMDGEDDVVWYVKLLSKILLRAGWSMEDVVETLGFAVDLHGDDYWLDFYQLSNCSLQNDHENETMINHSD